MSAKNDIWTLNGLRRELEDVNRALDEVESPPDQTAKSDAGKPQYTMVPPAILDSIERVRAYGNRKYKDPENWRNVEPQRYWEATIRHIRAAWTDYGSEDEESGLLHIEHAACNLAFLLQFISDRGKE